MKEYNRSKCGGGGYKEGHFDKSDNYCIPET